MSTNLAHYRAPICHGPETTNEARVVHVVCTLIANPSIYSGNLNLSNFFGVVYCNVCSFFSSYPMDHIGLCPWRPWPRRWEIRWSNRSNTPSNRRPESGQAARLDFTMMSSQPKLENKGLVTDIPWNKLTNYYKLSFIDWLGKIGWGGAYDHLSIDCLMQVSLSFSIKQQTSGKGIQSWIIIKYCRFGGSNLIDW